MTTTDALSDQFFIEDDDGKYHGPFASRGEAATFSDRFAHPKLHCGAHMRPAGSTQAEYERWLHEANRQLSETRWRYADLLDAFIGHIDMLKTLDENTRETLQSEVDGMAALSERLQAAEGRVVDRGADE